MPTLRRARYLSCFYCGKRTSFVYDSSVRQFTCPICDATNYLDKNGDITDPPTSTTAAAETTTPFFASGPEPFHDSFDNFGSPGSASSNGGFGSPGADGSSGVFCKTCVKNQHLFISSLAQYFPSDPNHPDTPELERKYFRFRQGLEQRYPQVCADCEPRVMDRIRAAGYTAKTDHLRRMVDYSRQVRLTRATPLDAANWFGRKLWWAGLFLQILWQVGIIGAYLLPSTIPSGDNTGDLGFDSDTIIDDSAAGITTNGSAHQTATALVLLQPLLRFLVYRTNFLRSACIATTLASCWWNPFFVQTVRGFTKHLLGISTWYGYQVTIVLVRLLLAKVVDYQAVAGGTETGSSSPTLPPMVAGVHAVAAFFILYLYTVAPRAIRKDVRPLFAKLPETPLTPQRANMKQISEQKQHELQQSENRRRGLETLSDVLDEISATPQRRTPGSMMQSSPLARRDSDTDGWDGWQPSQARSQNGFGSQQSVGNVGWQTGAGGRDASFSSLSLNGGGYGSTTPASQPPLSWSQEQQQYGQPYGADADEMDWTPTQPMQASHMPAQSPHRAFNTYEPSQVQNQFGRPQSSGAFSQTPVEADRGPFWYKVPPAPTSIAQRIFNRPNAPRLVNMEAGEDDVDTKKNAFFQNGSPGRQSRQLNLGLRDSLAGTSSSVEFAQPSFFAEDFQRKSKTTVNGAKGANGMNERGDPADNDDPDNVLSDLFSQTFSLAGEKEDAPSNKANGFSQRTSRLRASSSVRTPGSSSTSSVFGRAASLMTTVASLAAMYCLQDIASSSPSTGGRGGADTFVVQFIQPYARLIEAATVVYCAALALSLTLGSAKRRGLSSAVGLLFGLASLALAGWMATQMWAMLQEGQTQQRPSWPDANADVQAQDNGETHGWLANSVEQQETPLNESTLPWQWWQLASLHGTVLAHQAWNMLVQ